MHSRARLLALSALALVLPSVVTWATGSGAPPCQVGLEPAAAAECEREAILVTGRVQRPDGTPALGAVVVTSLGGQASTGADGRFELALDAPPDAPAFHVTAVATLRGASHAATTLVSTAVPGCTPSWIPTFGDMPGVDGSVRAFAAFDDGGGPALYVGGGFTTAGGVAASRVAKWDGSSWSPVGNGIDSLVRALAVFDDGSGPALYAGGEFTTAGGVATSRIAKWDGSSWSPVGSGIGGSFTSVYALTVFDDGGGPALYAGGAFDTAGGVAASRIAKWNGSTWSPLGSGTNSTVLALTAFDDGGGPALYASGWFTTAGGLPANRVAKWDGSGWSPLGGGLWSTFGSTYVQAIAVFDGGGPALHAGGEFDNGGHIHNIAKWDGVSWSPLGGGINGAVGAMTVFGDGGGPALYAGGEFTTAGGVAASRIAKWNGSSWSPIDSGMGGTVLGMTSFDDGGGPALFAGGTFTTAGGIAASHIAKWDGSSMSSLGSGINAAVRALAVFDDGGGPALYAAGEFTTAGGVGANRIAKWDGTSWSSLGSGMDGAVLALTVLDGGGGPALYAGGEFTLAGGVAANRIAQWDGSSWSSLGSGGMNFSVLALTVFDDGGGPALYAGGEFGAAGGVAASCIARWDGSSWSPLGAGMGALFFAPFVSALAVFDDGGGPALFAGGQFETAGGVAASHIAKWNGSSWSSLGSGMGGASVDALAVFDDGGGAALYAGGKFTTAGGVATGNLARWDGASWAPLGSGVNLPVRALTVFDDGGGPALYPGGHFTLAGGVGASRIAKWDGSVWSPVGSGMAGISPFVGALAIFDDGGGPALFAGGSFTSALDSGDSYLAKWGCPSAFEPVPGCHGNPATLSALSPGAQVGGTLSVQLDGGTFASGTAFLFAGGDGTDTAGCGPLVPALGELLLALAPAPVSVAQAATMGGSAAFSVAIPASPGLVGLTIAVQAVHVGRPPATPIELSSGLAVTFSG